MSLFQQYHDASLLVFPTLILCGGCAPKLKGLNERIQREIVKETKTDKQIKIVKSNVQEDALRWFHR